VLRDHRAAQLLLDHLGQMWPWPVDLAMREVLGSREAVQPGWESAPTAAYVVIPPAIAQGWQNPRKRVRLPSIPLTCTELSCIVCVCVSYNQGHITLRAYNDQICPTDPRRSNPRPP
jgi:hypothetical protein